jgi:hypothetical protein
VVPADNPVTVLVIGEVALLEVFETGIKVGLVEY